MISGFRAALGIAGLAALAVAVVALSLLLVSPADDGGGGDSGGAAVLASASAPASAAAQAGGVGADAGPIGEAVREAVGSGSAQGSGRPTGDRVTAARIFVLGASGRLEPLDVELPAHPSTRVQAEELVRRIVAESGTFPEGVRVLDVFLSARGAAVVNLSLDLWSGHPRGLDAEELTVYSVSHALLERFPSITEVRFLAEGVEMDTLAGHLDLRGGFGRAPAHLLVEPEGEREEPS